MLPEWVYQECAGISMVHRDAAISRQGELTKPAGALGRLEQLAIDLAGLQQTDRPRANRVPIIVFAGDHGVVAQGVSAYPQEVTIAMMSNFASGGAAISVLAGELGSSLEIVDAGTLAEQPIPSVVTDKPRRGSRDFSREEALQSEEIAFAFDCGRRAVARAAATEPDLLILGEMGIGNDHFGGDCRDPAGVGAEQMAGSGTGVAAGRAHKARVIDEALARHGLTRPPVSPERILCAVGGLEIAAIAGDIIAAAQRRLPILIDGFIVSVAALTAVRLNPSCQPFLLSSHQSAEQGHHLVLQALNAQAVVQS